jgi:hypothetical protein
VTEDNIVKLSQPGTFSDPLTEVLRAGARAHGRMPWRPRLPASSAALPTS